MNALIHTYRLDRLSAGSPDNVKKEKPRFNLFAERRPVVRRTVISTPRVTP
jgi:hypothetical protein